MKSRFSQLAADLEAEYLAAPPDAQARAAWAVARWAVDSAGLAHPAIAEALVSGKSTQVASVADQLDETYLQLQEQCDAGEVGEADVLAQFRRARAATAVQRFATGAPLEGFYEAAYAADDVPELTGLRRILAQALRGSV